MEQSFIYGFDLKFAKNAFVVVLSKDCTFSAGEITQMVGRANRASGAGQGRVFVTAQNLVKPETDMSYIERADRMREDDIGPNIIKGLVEQFHKVPASTRGNMFGVFNRFGWRKTRQQYERIVYPNVKAALNPYLKTEFDLNF